MILRILRQHKPPATKTVVVGTNIVAVTEAVTETKILVVIIDENILDMIE